MIRKISGSDVRSLFKVRVATRENAMSLAELESLGITEDSIKVAIEHSHCGWLCEIEGKTVGFAMGDSDCGEMTVIALLPEYECKGIGSQLLMNVENWLHSKGCNEIWLTTDIDPDLRAYGFYLKQGWHDSEIKDGLRHMAKKLT